MKCSLCGYHFEDDESMIECGGCIFSKGCNMVRCPNCGFETPAESKKVNVLKHKRREKTWI
jgi:rubredoxin